MALKAEKELKLYYSISEVARMFGVNESLLRYWEKEFPMISPKKAGGNIRQYRKEDIENIRLVYHLVKEKGMTLAGAKQRLKQNREETLQTANVVERLKRIREEDEHIPILFTSGRVSPKDVVKGYEQGVNNYVKKPFLAEELHAHVTALLKLTRGLQVQKNEVPEVSIGQLFSFDTTRGVLKQKGGEERMLTVREADLLRMLCEHKGQVVRREVILSRLWNTEEDYFASRSLDVFVSRLRKLLANDETVELKTVKGVGLILEERKV